MSGPKAYYDRDGVTIYHGDCREVLPALPRQSFSLTLTDPPFSVPVKYHDVDGDFPRSWGDLLVMEPFFADVFKGIKHATREDGQVYVHCDAVSYPVFFKIAYPLWPQQCLVVWYKPSGRRGRGWLNAHELVLHLRGEHTVYAEGFRQNVIGVMPVRTLNRQHPAEKPGELLDFLADALPPGTAKVLDPFAGSGTTLLCAKNRGLQAVGIESEERWCESIARRLEQGVLAFE